MSGKRRGGDVGVHKGLEGKGQRRDSIENIDQFVKRGAYFMREKTHRGRIVKRTGKLCDVELGGEVGEASTGRKKILSQKTKVGGGEKRTRPLLIPPTRQENPREILTNQHEIVFQKKLKQT